MNRGGFSWRRFFGLSGFKMRVSHQIGTPVTRNGRRQKLGALTLHLFLFLFDFERLNSSRGHGIAKFSDFREWSTKAAEPPLKKCYRKMGSGSPPQAKLGRGTPR